MRLPTVIGALTIFYSLLGVSLFVPIVGRALRARRAARRDALAIGGGRHRPLLFLQRAAVGDARIWLDPRLAGLVAAALVCLSRAGGGAATARHSPGDPARRRHRRSAARDKQTCSGWTARSWPSSAPARGIGEAVAQRRGPQGATSLCCDLKGDTAEATAAAIRADGGTAEIGARRHHRRGAA